MKKFSYLIMLISPMVFIVLMLIAILMVAFGGHSSGDMSFEFFFLVFFSIIYAMLIRKKIKGQIGFFSNALLILLTLLILINSAYFGILTILAPTGLMFDYFIAVIMFLFISSSLIVLVDCLKSNKK